ncbi:MAG: ABC transporter ATP-binding protein [Kiloniellales bacterium]
MARRDEAPGIGVRATGPLSHGSSTADALDLGPLLRAEDATRVLSGPKAGAVPVTLVKDIDLSIGRGEFVAITGPSGSGKSSLLYLLGLLDRPTEGEVYLDGHPTRDLSDARRARLRLEKLGFVFQFHFLLPEFDALHNVTLPLRKLGTLPAPEIDKRGLQLLSDLGLEDCGHKRPTQLSGGQRQRVAVARALANDPEAVLADEPTGNLDTHNAATVFDIFERLAGDYGRSVVVVTHDQSLAARCHRRIVLVDGEIVDDS